MTPPKTGTYVYCLIVADRRPTMRRRIARLPGMGSVRLLDVGGGRWLVAADAPLNRYGEETINRRLSDLDWVARAAMAHEAVIEAFIDQRAVLPMKLFTIFSGDQRALDHIRANHRRIDALVKRVTDQLEWGVRVKLDRARRNGPPPRPAPGRKGTRARGGDVGLRYLLGKKAQRDAAAGVTSRARGTVADFYDRLSGRSRLSARRPQSEMPLRNTPVLLDAAFLVPRARTATFHALAAREARRLGRLGLDVSLSGPWPPYTFVRD
jgi:hypothetical protein